MHLILIGFITALFFFGLWYLLGISYMALDHINIKKSSVGVILFYGLKMLALVIGSAVIGYMVLLGLVIGGAVMRFIWGVL